MNRGLLVVLFLAAVLTGMALPAVAQGSARDTCGPCVADAPKSEPYPKDTLYMSPVGYVRWIHFQETKVWLTIKEAAALIAEMGNPAPAK